MEIAAEVAARVAAGEDTDEDTEPDFQMSQALMELGMHLAILAAERFHGTAKRWPGAGTNGEVEADEQEVRAGVLAIVRELAPGSDEVPELVSKGITEV